MTREQRLARVYADAVNNREFSLERLALSLDRETPFVQASILRVGLIVMENIADKVITGSSDPEYAQAIWLAKELHYPN